MIRPFPVLPLLSLFLYLPGCQWAEKHPYPKDPLFVSNKPVENPSEKVSFPVLSLVEPTPPPVPQVVLAASPELAQELHARAVSDEEMRKHYSVSQQGQSEEW